MKHYIDKDALVAKIEKYISNYKGILNKVDKSSDDWVESTLILESKIEVLQHIISFLNTLEVKEVDLDKKIASWATVKREITMGTRDRFIELTQAKNDLVGTKERKIKANVCNIDFYYDKRIVFSNRAINVLESYNEIAKLIEE